jgi:RNA polymerase sigma-70 factor (ECF subfamily)
VLSLKKERSERSGTTTETTASLVDEPTDEALMVLLRGGDKEAMGCLFKRHVRPVRNVGHRILRDAAESDDLVQEVFLYVYRNCSAYDPSKGPARSWLIQVAYTQAFLRRRKLKSHGFYQPTKGKRPIENQDRENLGAQYDHTIEGLFGRNAWKQILEGLTEDQRETLRLHFFEGYTFTEIAEKLGQSFANVRNHHYRGLEKVRKYLAGNELNRR